MNNSEFQLLPWSDEAMNVFKICPDSSFDTFKDWLRIFLKSFNKKERVLHATAACNHGFFPLQQYLDTGKSSQVIYNAQLEIAEYLYHNKKINKIKNKKLVSRIDVSSDIDLNNVNDDDEYPSNIINDNSNSNNNNVDELFNNPRFLQNLEKSNERMISSLLNKLGLEKNEN